MRRQSTTSRVAARPKTLRPMSLLFGALYGMAGGLALALIALSGLLPAALPAAWTTMPLAVHGALTALGAVAGALVSLAREEG